MDRHLFLQSQPFLSAVSLEGYDALKKACEFFVLLRDANCIFQWRNNVLAFRDAQESVPSGSTEEYQFVISIMISKSKDGSKDATGLYFLLDQKLYFVNHTRISNLSLPHKPLKTLIHDKTIMLPPNAFIEFNMNLKIRIYLPNSVTNQREETDTTSDSNIDLKRIMEYIGEAFTPELFDHPAVQRKVLYSDPCNETDIDNIVSYAIENWVNTAELMDKLSTPSIPCIDIATYFLAPVTESARYAKVVGLSYPSKVKCDDYDKLARSFIASTIDSKSKRKISDFYSVNVAETENKIDEYLSQLYDEAQDDPAKVRENDSEMKKSRKSNSITQNKTTNIIALVNTEVENMSALTNKSVAVDCIPLL
jgi:hypothetical protein